MQPKPICVITGDIHFKLDTLELATSVVNQGLDLARQLNVPFVMNGDTLDSKAVIRGEISNRLIEILGAATDVTVYLNTGNHDLLNEAGEASSLNFLAPYCNLISKPTFINELNAWIIPYQNKSEKLVSTLKGIPAGATIIGHQGVMGAFLGDYVQDKTSLPAVTFKDYRTIMSHYHRRQDIFCGEGVLSYVGSPYTLSYGEANDSEKGINILDCEGNLTLVPTRLRKHVVLQADSIDRLPQVDPNDIVWVKLSGTRSELAKITKKAVAQKLGVENFKLDLVPYDTAPVNQKEMKKLTGSEILDTLISELPDSDTHKDYLKAMWRSLV